jgi:hypothetical protein
MGQQQLQEAQAYTADALKKERAAVTNNALAKTTSSLPKAKGNNLRRGRPLPHGLLMAGPPWTR